MSKVFAPGCALMIHDDDLVEKVIHFLNKGNETIELHSICCRHEPKLPNGTQVISACAGCGKRYGSLYEGISAVSIWELFDRSYDFVFPDYGGVKMSIHDVCPTKTGKTVHDAVRSLLKKMNIEVVEPINSREHSVCCGNSYAKKISVIEAKKHMVKRANEMECEDVVTYCVTCSKSMYNGGKKPRYLLDLLFNQPTEIGIYEPDIWNKLITDFIERH